MLSAFTFVAITALAELSRAQTVITFPGWRGNNLHQNGTAPQDLSSSMPVIYQNGSEYPEFPYGQQFAFPCGGMPVSQNFSIWPFTGGAISVQPGMFSNHQTSFFYFNLGVFENNELAPRNYSNILTGPIEVAGPNNSDWAGQFCLPQVPMPVNLNLKPHTNVTIQVIQTTESGASLYNCFDATLVDPHDKSDPLSSLLQNVNSQNCYNSSDITINQVFTTSALVSGAMPRFAGISSLVSVFALTGAVALFSLL